MSGEEANNAALIGEDASLLIVEDDKPFLTRLARAMEARGFTVETAESVEEAVAKARARAPAYAVVDMRLGDGNGLDVVAAIREKREDARTVILTGYGNIATAVTAVKLGAVDYLSKPADADDVFAALTRTSGERAGQATDGPVGFQGQCMVLPRLIGLGQRVLEERQCAGLRRNFAHQGLNQCRLDG